MSSAEISAVQLLQDLPGRWVYLVLSFALGLLAYYRLRFPTAFVFGVVWALAFADIRLGQSLPSTTERQAAIVEGVIRTIPQPMDQGFRFYFDIERTVEPDTHSSVARSAELV